MIPKTEVPITNAAILGKPWTVRTAANDNATNRLVVPQIIAKEA